MRTSFPVPSLAEDPDDRRVRAHRRTARRSRPMIVVFGLLVYHGELLAQCGTCTDWDEEQCEEYSMGFPCHEWENAFVDEHDRGSDMHTFGPELGLDTCEFTHGPCSFLRADAMTMVTEAMASGDPLAFDILLTEMATTVWTDVDASRTVVRILASCGSSSGAVVVLAEIPLPNDLADRSPWEVSGGGLAALAISDPGMTVRRTASGQ